MDRYTRGEVAYLLSLRRSDAIDDDIARPDSCALLSPDGPMSFTSRAEWDRVFTIARWHDVQGAYARAEISPLRDRILQLRLRGVPERDVALRLEVHHLFVHRAFSAAMEAILDELGGEAAPMAQLSIVPACLICGQRPRAILAAVRRREGKTWKLLAPERRASVCAECIAPERRPLLARAPNLAAAVKQNGGPVQR